MKAIEMRSMRPPVSRQKLSRRRDMRKNTNPGDQHEILDWEFCVGNGKGIGGGCHFRPFWRKVRSPVKHPGMKY